MAARARGPTSPQSTGPAGTAENVRTSVRAASEALSHLEAALTRGGFADGAPAYERMAEVLLGQRAWAASEGVPLEDDFEDLGAVARRIFAILEPYTTAMKRLAVLAPPDTESPRRRVLEAVQRHRRAVGATSLTRELGLDRSLVEASLAGLVEEGSLLMRKAGPSALYSLPRLARSAAQERPERQGPVPASETQVGDTQTSEAELSARRTAETEKSEREAGMADTAPAGRSAAGTAATEAGLLEQNRVPPTRPGGKSAVRPSPAQRLRERRVAR